MGILGFPSRFRRFMREFGPTCRRRPIPSVSQVAEFAGRVCRLAGLLASSKTRLAGAPGQLFCSLGEHLMVARARIAAFRYGGSAGQALRSWSKSGSVGAGSPAL